MKCNIYIIFIILIALIFLCIRNTIKSVDNFEILRNSIIDNMVINKSLITGGKNYKYPTYNVDIEGTHYTDKLCINNNYNSNCLNVNDLKAIKEMPHYYPKKLRIGNVVLNEQDFKNLKNIDLIIQTHYEIPTKNLIYLVKPRIMNSDGSRPTLVKSIPGHGNIWDDFWFHNSVGTSVDKAMVGDRGTCLFPCLTGIYAKTLHYPYPPPSSSCIGSQCLIQTDNGIKELRNINVGDKLLSLNTKTKEISYETIYYIRNHGDLPIIHYKIFLDNDVVIMSPKHLLIMEDNSYKTAYNIKIGDKVKNMANKYTIVKDIQYIYDIPLTPIVLSGTVVLPNMSVISCWSGDTKNADLMDNILNIMSHYTKKYNPLKVSRIFDKAYNYFKEYNKDILKSKELLNKINIEIDCF